MGQEVQRRTYTHADRDAFRRKQRRCLTALQQLLAGDRFADDGSTGIEIELNLIDADGRPALRSEEVLAAIDDESFQSELGRWNVEINVDPCSIAGVELDNLHDRLRRQLDDADGQARAARARMVMVGILPTLEASGLSVDSLSREPRYALLDEQIFLARGEGIHLDITGINGINGTDRLDMMFDSIAPEAACTSLQLHQQVAPERFAAWWNASQAVSGVQVALGANSPFLFGKELWRETRIALFEQATDTRSEELKTQGVRPRVWFGERWIRSVDELFDENLRYFPPLLPECDDEEPLDALAAGTAPQLHEMRLHNGTVYRWNRPVYDVVDGRPHLRVENRVLPAGPTVLDVMANAAFYYGVVQALVTAAHPIWESMPFAAAESNLENAARDGLGARLMWPGRGEVSVPELTLDVLLPLAARGLESRGVDTDTAGRLLAVIEGRCRTMQNGASWQVAQFHVQRQRAARTDALRSMLSRYVDLMHSNAPVHTWPVG